jgi:hypothetical protein
MSEVAVSFFIGLFVVNGLFTIMSIMVFYIRLEHVCKMPFVNYVTTTMFVCVICALIGSIWSIPMSISGAIVGFYFYHIFMIYIPPQPKVGKLYAGMLTALAIVIVLMIYSHRARADVYRQYLPDGSMHYKSTLEQPLYYPPAQELTGGYKETEYDRLRYQTDESPADEMLERIDNALEVNE